MHPVPRSAGHCSLCGNAGGTVENLKERLLVLEAQRKGIFLMERRPMGEGAAKGDKALPTPIQGLGIPLRKVAQ